MNVTLQATIKSNSETDAVSTLVVSSDTNIIGSDKLKTIELIGPAVAGFLPRDNPPYLSVSVTTISGSDDSLFKVGRNVKVTWGSTDLHIRSPVHVEEYGTLTLPDTIYIENGGILDICGTLSSDTGTITARDGGEIRISDPATTLNVYALFIDYKGHLGPSAYCTSSSTKVNIQTTFYNTSSDFTLDTSKFTVSAAYKGELSKIGATLQNTTCKGSGKLELKRNQFCELGTGTHNYKSVTIYPGAELRLLGHASGTKKTTVKADIVNVMFQGKILGVGKGFQSGGPGMPTSSDQGAAHGGKGLGNSKGPYGNVKAPMQYGSNGKGATATTKRGGGQIKLDVKNSITIDGEIDVSGQERGSGGSVYIISPEIYGFGTIRADGGDDGGGGGRISVVADDTYSFTGEFSVQGGADSLGKPTSPGLYRFISQFMFAEKYIKQDF